MKNIQLFGGPGTGKSTTASGLFHQKKNENYKVEYIQEFAKELTFANDTTRLGDQLLILGEQHHRLHRLKGKVDYIIHDSPFILGLIYLQDDKHIPRETFGRLITEIYSSYNNLNIFLSRNINEHGYQKYGRSQTLEESIQKDVEIKQMLLDNNIPFYEVEMGKNSVKDILELILTKI